MLLEPPSVFYRLAEIAAPVCCKRVSLFLQDIPKRMMQICRDGFQLPRWSNTKKLTTLSYSTAGLYGLGSTGALWSKFRVLAVVSAASWFSHYTNQTGNCKAQPLLRGGSALDLLFSSAAVGAALSQAQAWVTVLRKDINEAGVLLNVQFI